VPAGHVINDTSRRDIANVPFRAGFVLSRKRNGNPL
jgi:hypothetical protein